MINYINKNLTVTCYTTQDPTVKVVTFSKLKEGTRWTEIDLNEFCKKNNYELINIIPTPLYDKTMWVVGIFKEKRKYVKKKKGDYGDCQT